MRKAFGYRNYWVSRDGRVYSSFRQVSRGTFRGGFKTVSDKKPIKELKQVLDRGYLFVGLYRDGKMKKTPVHRLVLKTFTGKEPRGLLACHINGIPTDNRIENLYWGTPKQNSADMVRMGRQYKGEQHWHTRLTDKQVMDIKNKPRKMGVIAQLAEEYGISPYTVHAIRCGTTRKYLTNEVQ